jgi:hypothetical protein
MSERRGVYSVSFGKSEGKSILRSPRSRWEDNIKTDLVEFEFLYMEWIKLAQDRDTWWVLVNELIKFGFHKMQLISELAAKPVGFKRRAVLHAVSKCVCIHIHTCSTNFSQSVQN